jgi:hypothetical protein
MTSPGRGDVMLSRRTLLTVSAVALLDGCATGRLWFG